MDLMTGIAAVNALREAVTAFFTLKSEAERQSALIDIQSKMLALQSAMATLADSAEQHRRAQRQAEDEAAQLRQKLQSFQHYELRALPGGALVYAYQPPAGSAAPAHYACAHCWDGSQKKAILQPTATGAEATCPACKLTVTIDPSKPKWVPVMA